MAKIERFTFLAAVYLILIKDGKVLLLRRCNTSYQDGNYGLVSGHLEGGETAKQGIIREAYEEAGIILNPEDLEVVNIMQVREYFNIFLRAEKWSGDIINKELDKCDDLAWYDLNGLPKNIVPEIKFALENDIKKLQYTEFGWAD